METNIDDLSITDLIALRKHYDEILADCVGVCKPKGYYDVWDARAEVNKRLDAITKGLTETK
tara:strand:+ start:1558 stop:1743 length:186 start_codon:yes stop_codon:yes gene_type:complete